MTGTGRSTPSGANVLPYAVTIFLSAFLLFEVQPMMAKFLLPFFGGAAGVWATCLFFFQFVLLAGYAYAHGLTSFFSVETQKRIHSALLAGSVLLLVVLGKVWEVPFMPSASWDHGSGAHPALTILKLLAMGIGLPFFVLTSTSPLLQKWFSGGHPGFSPYRFYALSNFGSMLGLVAYPFLIEWLMPLKTQARAWAWVYVAYVVLCVFCALTASRQGATGDSYTEPGASHLAQSSPDPSLQEQFLWLGLAACGSILVLATTNQLCLGVASVPLLWMLPLGIYLLTFIICFERSTWYKREIFHPVYALAAGLATYALYEERVLRLVPEGAIYAFVLFAGCMVCHGELFRHKPEVSFLTRFYLMIAAGGALGGVFVSLLAPLLFRGFWEYHIGLWGTAGMVSLAFWWDENSWVYHSRGWRPILLLIAACFFPFALALAVDRKDFPKDWRFSAMLIISVALVIKFLRRRNGEIEPATSPRLAKLSLIVSLAILAGVLIIHIRVPSIEAARNFYGVITVSEGDPKDPEWSSYRLRHGPTLHGAQFRDPLKRGAPTTYYGVTSAVGLAILNHPRRHATRPEDRALRIGTVGLGVGTIAAYGEAGDTLRFYEINPNVIRIARSPYFSFLADTPARVEIVPGDARISMESELAHHEPQQYDILVLDAFSGDSIPVHLLTREAFEIYLRHLRQPDGTVLVHISNSYVDLRPVLWKIAEHFHLQPAWVFTPRIGHISSPCEWVLLAPNRKFLGIPEIASHVEPEQFFDPSLPLWTDDYSNLIRILKW